MPCATAAARTLASLPIAALVVWDALRRYNGTAREPLRHFCFRRMRERAGSPAGLSRLVRWRRRVPDAHRRRDVGTPSGDRRPHGRDGPAALGAMARLRSALVLAYGAEHVARIGAGEPCRARTDADSRSSACPGKGILGRIWACSSQRPATARQPTALIVVRPRLRRCSPESRPGASAAPPACAQAARRARAASRRGSAAP
jgi:hypothetical protein